MVTPDPRRQGDAVECAVQGRIATLPIASLRSTPLGTGSPGEGRQPHPQFPLATIPRSCVAGGHMQLHAAKEDDAAPARPTSFADAWL